MVADRVNLNLALALNLGVADGERVGQGHLTDMQPGPGGTDDAGEGEGRGAQAGSGREVREGIVGGDEECVLRVEGGEASGNGVTGAEQGGKKPNCTIC